MSYTPYTKIDSETLKQVSDQYSENLKLYLAIANWSTIIKCLIAEFRGIPEHKYLTQINHPCQIHYGFSTKPNESIEQLVRNTTTEILGVLKPSKDKLYKAVHLGSGIGGADFQIGEIYQNIDVTGFSIAKAQVDLANSISKEKQLSSHVRFIQCNYLNIPEEYNETFDFGYAIESFFHTPTKTLSVLFNQVNKLMKPHSYFVISDGFFHHAETNKEKELYHDFLAGWDLPQLTNANDYINAVTSCGFRLVSNIDKTENVLSMASKLKTRTIVGICLIWIARKLKIKQLINLGLTGKNVDKFSKVGLVQQDVFKKRILEYRVLVFQKM